MSVWKKIHHAAIKADRVELESLIDSDPSLANAADPLGDTPMHVAAYHGFLDIVAALLAKGANAASKNHDGKTPYLVAKARGNKQVAERLAEAEKAAMMDFDSSLFDAIREGSVDIVSRILDMKGRLKNQRDADGDAPIHVAALEGRAEIVELLLDTGVNVNDMGNKGNTPLHYAALKGHADVAKILLDRGAQANMMGEDGKTPLHSAAMWGKAEVAELLIARGAQIDAHDNDGLTPMKRAEKWRRKDIVALLEKHSEKN